MNKEERIAITFGDAGENHPGMELLGSLGEKGSGFSINDLDKLKKYFEKKEFETEYINLNIENNTTSSSVSSSSSENKDNSNNINEIILSNQDKNEENFAFNGE